MKRDFELIRRLLLDLEQEDEVDLSTFSSDQILYHKALLFEVGLVDGPKPHYLSANLSEIPDRVFAQKLTWAGHDFIDAIRDEGRWQKVKEFIKGSGKILTLHTIKEAIASLFT